MNQHKRKRSKFFRKIIEHNLFIALLRDYYERPWWAEFKKNIIPVLERFGTPPPKMK